jgi:chaperonin cofactor prefoldin
LVVNLTKHIQLKGNRDEEDPEEFQKIFPSFMWIVRDFTLQLQDQAGNRITQKEYLEQALKETKGTSDSTEQKNRIRRLLKAFFTERDCVTTVRPINEESELQNLAKLPLERLRPEFQEQVKMLRKKLLGKMKPKQL